MLRHTFYLFASTVLAAAHLVYGQGGPASAPAYDKALVDNLVKMHQVWGPPASTPNTLLRVIETPASQTKRFRLMAEGIPKDAVYTLIMWSVTQKGPTEALKGITIDASGLAICAGTPGTCGSPEKPNDPIDLVLQAAPGEPVRVALISADGLTKVFAKLVPIPWCGEDRGCSVEAVLLTPGAELVLIVGSGFLPNSDVAMDSVSEGERHGDKVKTDATGRYTTAILPYRQGVARGTTKVILKTAQCAPTVEFSWGRHSKS